MSYQSGVGPGLAKMFGMEPGGPRITCDGCKAVLAIRDDRLLPRWFMDGKAAPGWKLTRTEEARTDLCPRCK